MPFNRPKLEDLIGRNQAEIASRLPGTDPRLRRSFLDILARVNAGAEHSLYGFLSWAFDQLFVDTAEKEYLDRWGSIWGVVRKPATKASGITVATGANGANIPSGTQLSRSDGALFITTIAATISSGTANLAVTALSEGTAGNTAASSILTFVSTPPNVNSQTTVNGSALTGGTDIESDTFYLSRILDRIQKPPHGGNSNDYIQWAKEVPGVTRAWVYPLELGPGTVSVRFMMDDTYSNGIPQAGDVTTVQNYIEARRPVTADVTVLAPTPITLNYNIHLNLSDTAAIRAAIDAELKELIRRDAVPGGTLYLSRINEAISIASGEFDHVLNTPNSNPVYTTGQIAVHGTITWS